jgi:hypothetical protein
MKRSQAPSATSVNKRKKFVPPFSSTSSLPLSIYSTSPSASSANDQSHESHVTDRISHDLFAPSLHENEVTCGSVCGVPSGPAPGHTRQPFAIPSQSSHASGDIIAEGKPQYRAPAKAVITKFKVPVSQGPISQHKTAVILNQVHLIIKSCGVNILRRSIKSGKEMPF